MANADLSDEEKFRAYGMELVLAVDAAIRPWLSASAERVLGGEISPEINAAIDDVASDANGLLRELVEADVDQPLSGPLERIRRATTALAPALDAAGAQRPRRDPFDVEHQPDDVFALGPIAFSDLGEDVHMAGITWGAAKAHLHLQRRKLPE